MLKRIIRQLARSAGYEIRKTAFTPHGQDWVVDVQRLLAGRRSPVLFDVGANIGAISERLARAFPASAQIFAFEPAAQTYATLAVAMSQWPRVQAQRLALSEREGKLQLFHGINSELHRLTQTGSLGTGTSEEVEVTTLDAIARKYQIERIDLLKTDTEGFDVAVLRGARDLLERGAISAVLSEATFDEQSEWHTRFDDLRAFLTPRGFSLHGIYDCTSWGSRLRYANVLFVRTEEFAPAG